MGLPRAGIPRHKSQNSPSRGHASVRMRCGWGEGLLPGTAPGPGNAAPSPEATPPTNKVQGAPLCSHVLTWQSGCAAALGRRRGGRCPSDSGSSTDNGSPVDALSLSLCATAQPPSDSGSSTGGGKSRRRPFSLAGAADQAAGSRGGGEERRVGGKRMLCLRHPSRPSSRRCPCRSR